MLPAQRFSSATPEVAATVGARSEAIFLVGMARRPSYVRPARGEQIWRLSSLLLALAGVVACSGRAERGDEQTNAGSAGRYADAGGGNAPNTDEPHPVAGQGGSTSTVADAGASESDAGTGAVDSSGGDGGHGSAGGNGIAGSGAQTPSEAGTTSSGDAGASGSGGGSSAGRAGASGDSGFPLGGSSGSGSSGGTGGQTGGSGGTVSEAGGVGGTGGAANGMGGISSGMGGTGGAAAGMGGAGSVGGPCQHGGTEVILANSDTVCDCPTGTWARSAKRRRCRSPRPTCTPAPWRATVVSPAGATTTTVKWLRAPVRSRALQRVIAIPAA